MDSTEQNGVHQASIGRVPYHAIRTMAVHLLQEFRLFSVLISTLLNLSELALFCLTISACHPFHHF